MRPCRSSLGLAALCALIFASPAAAGTDKYRSQQWGLDAISAPVAWERSAGEAVVVAVVDTGVEIDHPDLEGAIWTNPDEVAGNGVDDDQNGIVDDVHGANLLDGNADLSDGQDHGTGVAGIIAARAGNGIGGAGVAPQAQIMPLKVCGDRTGCPQSAEARAIRYAIAEGARIINISIAGDRLGDELRDAVAFAEANGATIVAAAGNARLDIDATPAYPAGMSEPGVLAVTAVEKDGALLDEASWGARTVDIGAPGATIVTTSTGADYRLSAGTSMATPFVSGSLALLAAERPELSQAELRAALLETAGRTSKLQGRVATGMLDVGAAMRRLVPGDWGTAPAPAAGDAAPVRAGIASSRARIDLRAPRRTRGGRRIGVRWTGARGVAKWRLTVRGHTRTLGAGKRGTATYIGRRAKRVRVKVMGVDADGRKVVSAVRTVRVVR